ncbi:hypothetical protein ES708_31162 [subsurface metagenome]
MSKKIFTKVFKNVFAAEKLGTTIFDALETWLLQEDIEVIGASAVLGNELPSENDGYSHGYVELSQVGKGGMDGALLKVTAGEGWNTAPPGICRNNGHVFVTFPAGFAVPVKEEGYLYINAEVDGKSAGVDGYGYEVIVYYTKGSSRRR